ncbi:hypothetical protein SprV_0501892100 [Sparganum proliferum]
MSSRIFPRRHRVIGKLVITDAEACSARAETQRLCTGRSTQFGLDVGAVADLRVYPTETNYLDEELTKRI